MPALTNLTPFAATDFLSLTKAGEECLVVIAVGSFALPPAGRPSEAPLVVCERQSPPVTTDTYWGEPETSSLRYESQSAYTRPGTDVLLHGQAWAPRGRKVTCTQVAVRVGPLEKRAIVSGTRVWYRSLMGLSASDALPFESMPLRYEQAFGGSSASAHEARNPVGQGFYSSSREALERSLPSIEAPDALVRSWSDRPGPWGFGPVARHWQPRLRLSGTYDATWQAKRAPLWPQDFDERFFHAAPEGLRTSTHLRGGEQVVLEGVSPDGLMAFRLPTQRLMARCVFARRRERRPMSLDTVLLEPEERRLVLTWRATFPAHGVLATHEMSTVRLLEPWEDLP